MPLSRGLAGGELGEHAHRNAHIAFALSLCVVAIANVATKTESTSSLVVLLTAEAVVLLALGVGRTTGRLKPDRSLAWWPIALLSTLFAFSFVAPGAIMLVSGVIVLTFLFIGLTLPPGRTLYFLPAAIAVVVSAWNLPLAETLVRLPIATLVWFLVGEVPARLIHDLRQQRNLLRTAAVTDSLTGLLNRSTLESELGLLTKDDSIAVIDLDHFKDYNDKFGHLSGDEALREFAKALVAGSRVEDKIFRYGGEEFLIIFRSTSVDDAKETLMRLTAGASADHVRMAFSAGVTFGGPDAVRRGDRLLYEAKASGRDRIHTHQSEADHKLAPS